MPRVSSSAELRASSSSGCDVDEAARLTAAWDRRQERRDDDYSEGSDGMHSVSISLVGMALLSGLVGLLFFGGANGCDGEGRATLAHGSRAVIENTIASAPLWMRNLILAEVVFTALKWKFGGQHMRGWFAPLILACILAIAFSLSDRVDWENAHATKILLTLAASVLLAVSLFLLSKACRRVSGNATADVGIVTALLVGSSTGEGRDAGWDAIVGSGMHCTQPQPSWGAARDARNMVQAQAVATTVAKLMLWHLSQPAAYLWMLGVYSCELSLAQKTLASVVGAREAVYIVATMFAAMTCPVFLLLDLKTTWNEAETKMDGIFRVAAFCLTPNNFVMLCIGHRFKPVRKHLVGIVAAQLCADFASCFALGLLLLGLISEERPAMSALVIGYSTTAVGFILFFGPLATFTKFVSSTDHLKSARERCFSALIGSGLLVGLASVVLTYFLLFCRVDIICHGVLGLGSRDCGHGTCNRAACECELGAFGDNCEVLVSCASVNRPTDKPASNCSAPTVSTLCQSGGDDGKVRYQCATALQVFGVVQDPLNLKNLGTYIRVEPASAKLCDGVAVYQKPGHTRGLLEPDSGVWDNHPTYLYRRQHQNNEMVDPVWVIGGGEGSYLNGHTFTCTSWDLANDGAFLEVLGCNSTDCARPDLCLAGGGHVQECIGRLLLPELRGVVQSTMGCEPKISAKSAATHHWADNTDIRMRLLRTDDEVLAADAQHSTTKEVTEFQANWTDNVELRLIKTDDGDSLPTTGAGADQHGATFVLTQDGLNNAPGLYAQFLTDAIADTNRQMQTPGYFCSALAGQAGCNPSTCKCTKVTKFFDMSVYAHRMRGALTSGNFIGLIGASSLDKAKSIKLTLLPPKSPEFIGAVRMQTRVNIGFFVPCTGKALSGLGFLTLCCGGFIWAGNCDCRSGGHNCGCDDHCSGPDIKVMTVTPTTFIATVNLHYDDKTRTIVASMNGCTSALGSVEDCVQLPSLESDLQMVDRGCLGYFMGKHQDDVLANIIAFFVGKSSVNGWANEMIAEQKKEIVPAIQKWFREHDPMGAPTSCARECNLPDGVSMSYQFPSPPVFHASWSMPEHHRYIEAVIDITICAKISVLPGSKSSGDEIVCFPARDATTPPLAATVPFNTCEGGGTCDAAGSFPPTNPNGDPAKVLAGVRVSSSYINGVAWAMGEAGLFLTISDVDVLDAKLALNVSWADKGQSPKMTVATIDHLDFLWSRGFVRVLCDSMPQKVDMMDFRWEELLGNGTFNHSLGGCSRQWKPGSCECGNRADARCGIHNRKCDTYGTEGTCSGAANPIGRCVWSQATCMPNTCMAPQVSAFDTSKSKLQLIAPQLPLPDELVTKVMETALVEGKEKLNTVLVSDLSTGIAYDRSLVQIDRITVTSACP